MNKSPNFIISFTLPFFIALVFMLSAFTYTMGDMFQSTPPKKVQLVKAEVKAANVLGVTNASDGRPRPEPEVVIETSEAPKEKPKEYKSVVINADGTKTEINGYLENGEARVSVIHYDMFGEKIKENNYSEKEYTELKTRTSNSQNKNTGVVTKDNISQKLLGLGYTYNPEKVTIIKSDKGSTFKVPAYTTQKLFGIFKVNITVDLLVNSSDGKIDVSKSVLMSIVDFLSK